MLIYKSLVIINCMSKVTKEMVLFATDDQFSLKYGELLISECYWTIPMYPKDKENLVGSKIYFYLRSDNVVMASATITDFGEHEGKKTVLFEFNDDDYEFETISLDHLGHEKTKQNRGWCYQWW